MQLRVKEYRFEINRLSKTRKEKITKEEVLKLEPGYISFNGVRENFPYDKLFFVQTIDDNQAIIVAFNENINIKKEIVVHINEESSYRPKSPRGLPFGYYYVLKMEEELHENK